MTFCETKSRYLTALKLLDRNPELSIKYSNVLLRGLSKKIDLSGVNENELRLNLYLLNNGSRKFLNRKSAFEVFFIELVQLI